MSQPDDEDTMGRLKMKFTLIENPRSSREPDENDDIQEIFNKIYKNNKNVIKEIEEEKKKNEDAEETGIKLKSFNNHNDSLHISPSNKSLHRTKLKDSYESGTFKIFQYNNDPRPKSLIKIRDANSVDDYRNISREGELYNVNSSVDKKDKKNFVDRRK